MEYKAAEQLVIKQEEMLQFEHFNNQDAWELGQLVVEEIHKNGIELAVSIRKLNGNIIFQYATDKTNLNNQNWMNRKFNTVLLMERSSLGSSIVSKITKEEVVTHGLSDSQYVFCGGGFPIRIKGSCVVAVITVSNMPHVKDHDFIVKCLSKFLRVTGVPEVDLDI
ncbi:heme-binding protein, partial [Clostridium sp.]|uniref:heme-degrading domain-containing protein n=1 Tax=Clostridium sp. TaxID=1506 RepID=UPI001A59A135